MTQRDFSTRRPAPRSIACAIVLVCAPCLADNFKACPNFSGKEAEDGFAVEVVRIVDGETVDVRLAATATGQSRTGCGSRRLMRPRGAVVLQRGHDRIANSGAGQRSRSAVPGDSNRNAPIYAPGEVLRGVQNNVIGASRRTLLETFGGGDKVELTKVIRFFKN